MSSLYALVQQKRRLGLILNTWFLRRIFLHVGSRVSIDPSVWYSYPRKVFIEDDCEIRRGVVLIGRSGSKVGIHLGQGVHIHQYAILDAYGGFIKLGEGVRIGHHSVVAGHGGVTFDPYSGVAGLSYVIAANHGFRGEKPHVLQEESKKGIRVGSNVWGGCGVIILDGVHIGDNSVIGAGAVVRKDVPENSVVLGNPARVAYTFDHARVAEADDERSRREDYRIDRSENQPLEDE